MTSNFFQTITQHTTDLIAHAATQASITTPPRIILGLSGGPDSTFLLLILASLHKQGLIELIAVHLDHGWRPESANDITFCQKLCSNHTIQFIHTNAQKLNVPFTNNGSKEEFGRKLRRFYFEQVKQQYNAHFIALAHHLDDQEETFFLRLIRGTSLAGLRCMDAIDTPYLRPLLSIKKQEIIDYLDANKISYLIDPTNAHEDFLRNKIRKFVIPALRNCDTRFDPKFQTTLNMLKIEDTFLQHVAEKTFHEVFCHDQEHNMYYGDLHRFGTLDAVLQQRIIIIWLIAAKIPFAPSTSLVEEILRFLHSPRGGSHTIGATATVHKKQKQFWVSL